MGVIQSMTRALWASDGQKLARIAQQLRTVAERDGVILLPTPSRQRATYDRLIDALNRLPRPAMALGTLALLVAAMVAPDWFASRMDGLSRMPDALWWVIGAVISLFFGARFQTVDQAFQRELAASVMPDAARQVDALTPGSATTGTDAGTTLLVEVPASNPALSAYHAGTKT